MRTQFRRGGEKSYSPACHSIGFRERADPNQATPCARDLCHGADGLREFSYAKSIATQRFRPPVHVASFGRTEADVTDLLMLSPTGIALVQSGLEDWFFITADVAFGHSLANESKAVVEANGGSVVGEVRHPYISTDFTSFLLQGQASGADVVALANSGADTTNSIKQAMEFGVNQTAKVVALLAFITDIKSLGLETTQGLLLTESFYWDLNEETRAWSERFAAKMDGQMPSMAHAAVYSGVSHYLKAVDAVGSREGQLVADKMRELPINDFMIKNGTARKDGRIVHDFYMFEVKSPDESEGPWDLYKLVRTIPAEEGTPPEGTTGCQL